MDALLIAQHYVGLNPANFDSTVADVDGSGDISIVDALLVAQFYVGLIPELTGCEPEETPVPPDEVTYELQAEDESWSTGGVESDLLKLMCSCRPERITSGLRPLPAEGARIWINWKSIKAF